MNNIEEMNIHNLFIKSLISGGLAGTFVDVALYPLDTIKTRLQSQYGFLNSGGFRNVYKGISPILFGSAPTAALFFITYENIKILLQSKISENYFPILHMGAASVAEVVSCLIRVPVEVLKQRKQALLPDAGRLSIRLLYRGYWSTVLRDIPFSLIQFSLWEHLKKIRSQYTNTDVIPVEGAICGAIAGGIAAAITTPLDVAKTRIILSNKSSTPFDVKVSKVLLVIYKESGIQGLFSGLGPRVMWITMGGFIFFGVYEKTKALLSY